MRQKVKALETKLQRVQDADDIAVTPKRAGRAAASRSAVQKEVRVLKSQVRRLEKVRKWICHCPGDRV